VSRRPSQGAKESARRLAKRGICAISRAGRLGILTMIDTGAVPAARAVAHTRPDEANRAANAVVRA
jgi:hypothetical protein